MALFSRQNDSVESSRRDPDALRELDRSPRAARRTTQESDPDAMLDPAASAKTRARRRLIGAVALALAAIVFVPLLFDTQPPAATDDIDVQIPDRGSPFKPQRPVQGASTPQGLPSDALDASTPTTTSPHGDASASAASDKPVAVRSDATAVEPRDVTATRDQPSQTQDRSADKSKPQAPAVTEKPATAQARTDADDPRAIAALEGKSATTTAARSTSEPAQATKSGYAVQIAAFSVADKARSLRDRLNANGFKSYTEPLATPQGERTRVRLGPFPSREAAERAREKLKTMKLDGSVVPL